VEKAALESSLYRTEQTNTQLESVKQQLTNDNHELLVTKNSLQRECLLAAYVGKSFEISFFAKSNRRFSFLMRLLIIGKYDTIRYEMLF